MKIIYLANLRLPTEKAYGIQIAKMCEAFANGGHEVKLFFPYRKNSTISQDIFSYYSVKKNFTTKEIKTVDFYFPGFLDKIAFLIKNYFSAKALVKEALKENYDIYYTRDERVAKLLNGEGKNVIFECHRFSNKRKSFYSYFKNNDLKTVAISDGLKEDLVNFGIKDTNILVARDGVDLEEFNIQMTKEDARKILFEKIHNESFGRKKIAVYIGSLYPWKGYNIFSETVFLKTIRELVAENVNYLICIFGGTDMAIKELQEELNRNLHKNSNLIPMLSFGGRVPHQIIPIILKAADCAILTGNELDLISAKYTSPLKMFEYMASGCPIVTQDLPSFREVLNEDNAVFAKTGDAKDLAQKIAWVFDDNNKELVEKIAKKAREDVENYTWEKRVEKIISFIK